jgi:transposase
MEQKAYPSDVHDDAWAFVAPYVTLMSEDAPQRTHPVREIFHGWRRTGAIGLARGVCRTSLSSKTRAFRACRWVEADTWPAMVRGETKRSISWAPRLVGWVLPPTYRREHRSQGR